MPDRQRLTPSQAEFFDHLPKQQVAAGPAQAAAIQACAGPVTEDRRELIISHGCALTVVLYFPDRTRLISYNDMGHLSPSMRGTDYPLAARS